MNIFEMAMWIRQLKPGEQCKVDRLELRQIAPPINIGATWEPPDRVMENIIGSAYEFQYWEDRKNGTVYFRRLREPLTDGRRSYVSPDRRDYFVMGPDGLWHPARLPLPPEPITTNCANYP